MTKLFTHNIHDEQINQSIMAYMYTIHFILHMKYNYYIKYEIN